MRPPPYSAPFAHLVLFLVVTDRKHEALTCRHCFLLTCRFFGFFAPQGRHVTPIKVKFGKEEQTVGPPCQISPWSAQGLWVYGPKTLKNWNFINIIAPKRRVPCTILTKFTSFMRVLSLNKSAKFGCFSSINDKIINNLPRWGRFPPNFRWP